MNRISRISNTAFPALPVRRNEKARATDEPATEPVRIIDPAHQTTTRRHIPARPGPAAPFLAQYVNQHWPWPRDPEARVRARRNAACAYGTTDALPLRAHNGRDIDRKI